MGCVCVCLCVCEHLCPRVLHFRIEALIAACQTPPPPIAAQCTVFGDRVCSETQRWDRLFLSWLCCARVAGACTLASAVSDVLLCNLSAVETGSHFCFCACFAAFFFFFLLVDVACRGLSCFCLAVWSLCCSVVQRCSLRGVLSCRPFFRISSGVSVSVVVHDVAAAQQATGSCRGATS